MSGRSAVACAGGAGTIGALGEFAFLGDVLARIPPASADVLLGAGDDCALVAAGGARLLLTIDATVEGVHFERAWMSPREVGRKALLVNASDVAAMGGRPRWVLIALGAPPEFPSRDLRALQAGIVAAAGTVGADVVGGNLTRGPSLSVTIAMIAIAPSHPVTRTGARAGHSIYVTGTVGDSAVGRRQLAKGGSRRSPTVRRFVAPDPRLQAGQLLAEGRFASSMIDVSDGLLQDLGHLCEASGIGADLNSASLPLSTSYRRACGADLSLALTGGEDYELLFSVSPGREAPLQAAAARAGCRLSRIGQIAAGTGVRVDGVSVDPRGQGFDHFRSRVPTLPGAPPRGVRPRAKGE